MGIIIENDAKEESPQAVGSSNTITVDKRLFIMLVCATCCSFLSLLITFHYMGHDGAQQATEPEPSVALAEAEEPEPSVALTEAEVSEPSVALTEAEGVTATDGTQGAQSGKKWEGLKWACLGDSLTEINYKTKKRYYEYVADNTGIEVVNLGRSAIGYKKGDNFPNHAFYQRIDMIPTDSDVVTIFGSFNDLSCGAELGSITDVGTDTICGCINTAIDKLYEAMPTVRLGIVTPTPWDSANPLDDGTDDDDYVQAIIDICARRSIPCLDLYHCSGLRPWDEQFRALCYTMDSGLGIHPNEIGHGIIAPSFEAFLDTLLPY